DEVLGAIIERVVGIISRPARGCTAGVRTGNARLTIDAFDADIRYTNVLASVHGPEPRNVMFVAHYDSSPLAGAGAIDCATGCAVLCELARRFTAAPASVSVHFAFVDG